MVINSNLIAEADANNIITRYYIYGQGLLAAATPAGALYCYHFDATGHTVALSDANRNLVDKYAYTPFGVIANQAEAFPQPFKYAGRHGVMTEPNGLYYMRARYYDPAVGRFISEDPLGFDSGDLNLYAYVGNNPINFIDPEGLSPVGWIIRLTRTGMKKISSLGSKSAAEQARRQGQNVLAASRQQAKAIEKAAHGGKDLMRHKGHDLPGGNTGRPHFQSEGKYGHTFWGAAVGLIGLFDPFDAISGELSSDDMLYPDGVFPENNCQK